MSDIFIAKIVLKLVFAVIAGVWAHLKNRNVLIWGLAGFVFSLFTLAVLIFLPRVCAQCGARFRRLRSGALACLCGPVA